MDLPDVILTLVVCGVILFVWVAVLSRIIEMTEINRGEPLYQGFEILYRSIGGSIELSTVAYGATGAMIAALLGLYAYSARNRR
jgi:hypothetical protein